MSGKRQTPWAKTQQIVTIVVLFVLPAIGVGVLLYELHTPSPRARTPVVITRASLLPHRFAGPCLNCHHIQDVGPVELNAANMGAYQLLPWQRRVLLAGQRVDVPNLAQRLRTPAILRDDILPHNFVGVCSNCHPVLDVRPSNGFMRRSMRRAYQPLANSGLERERIARGGVREHHSSEFLRNLFGYIALGLFAVACVYVVIRQLMRSYPQTFKGKFKVKQWFKVHEWAASAFTLSAVAHWYFSDRGNNFLHLALIGVIWLTGAGYALRYRTAHKKTRKPVQLVHTQRFVFVGLLILLVVGHLFAEFE